MGEKADLDAPLHGTGAPAASSKATKSKGCVLFYVGKRGGFHGMEHLVTEYLPSSYFWDRSAQKRLAGPGVFSVEG